MQLQLPEETFVQLEVADYDKLECVVFTRQKKLTVKTHNCLCENVNNPSCSFTLN